MNKIKAILNDRSKFCNIHDDVLLQILNKGEKINRYLQLLKVDNVTDKNTYLKLCAAGSNPV